MMISLTLLILALMPPATERRLADNDYAGVAALCADRNAILKANNANIVCLNGSLDRRTIATAASASYAISYAVVNSDGGDVALALSLGRKLFRDRATVIVSGRCMSSCANYLVPAAAGLVVLGPSTIVMHGSIPSNLISYTARVRIADPAAKPQEIAASYREARDGIIRDEAAFFDDINTDRSYIDRYVELTRSLTYSCKPDCPRYSDVYLALDRAYLEYFGVHVIEWRGEPQYETVVKLRFGSRRDIGLMIGFMGVPVRDR